MVWVERAGRQFVVEEQHGVVTTSHDFTVLVPQVLRQLVMLLRTRNRAYQEL